MKHAAVCLLVLFLVAALGLGGCSADKPAQEGSDSQQQGTGKSVVKVRYAGSMPESHNISMGAKYWAEQVEEMSNGRMQVELFYNGEIGMGREAIEALQMGNLEVTDASVAALAGFTKAFYPLNLPYVFTSREQAYKLLDGELGEKLRDELTKVDLIGISFYELGFRHLTNNVREVRNPADLAGLKIRVMENPIHIALWNTLGAQASPLAWAEVFTALQQGAMDGQENPITNIVTNRLYEVQKYISLTCHVYDSTVILMSKKFFDSLDPELQQVVVEAGIKATDYQRKLAQQQESEMLQQLRDLGQNVIIELTEAQILEFKKAAEPVYKQFEAEIPADMLKYLSI